MAAAEDVRGVDRFTTQALNRRVAAIVLLGAAVLLLVRLGARDLWAPDEPRYAQIAEELRSMEHGAAGLVLLHLNGDVYTQKPPLYYWLAAAMGAPFGHVSERAARLPSALAGIGVVALVVTAGSHLVGGPAALTGAGLLLTANLFAEAGRRAQLDVLLTLFETLALLLFWRFDRGLGRRRTNLAWLHVAMGLAVLTKGPVGVLVPLAVIAVYLGFERRLGDLRRVFALWALPLSLGPGLLWLAGATALAPAGYFSEAVGSNVFGRFFAGTSHERPFYYFLYQFPVDFLPWTLLAPIVYAVGRKQVFAAGASEETRRSWRFLLAWVGASLVFFSISSGKRGVYMLPAFPAAALLCASALPRFLGGRMRLPNSAHWIAAAFASVVAAAGVAVAAGAVPLDMPRSAGIGIVSVMLLAAAAWLGFHRARVRPMGGVGIAIATVFALELGAFAWVYPTLDPEKSPAPIARAAAALTAPGSAIGLVSDRALIGGLAYYGDRPIEQLDGPEEIERFFAEGGRAIVVKERKVERITAVVPVDVHFRARSGRRTIVVVTPRAAQGG